MTISRRPIPFHLIEDAISQDTVAALEQLLLQAKQGKLVGMAFVCMYRRRQYIANTTGECRRNPTFCRGMLKVLDDKVSKAISPIQPPY